MSSIRLGSGLASYAAVADTANASRVGGAGAPGTPGAAVTKFGLDGRSRFAQIAGRGLCPRRTQRGAPMRSKTASLIARLSLSLRSIEFVLYRTPLP